MSLRNDFALYLGSKPVYQAVYETLRDAIVCGQIPKGERLLEVYYAEVFNVSRTPVRTAFKTLINNGLAVESPGGGIEATGLDIGGIDNIFRFQQALERLAFPQMIHNITDDEIAALICDIEICESEIGSDTPRVSHLNESIHRRLFEISRFEGIMQAVDLAYGFVQAFSLLASRDIERQAAITCEHKAMVNAVKQRDIILLSSVADFHLEACKLYAVRFYQQSK